MPLLTHTCICVRDRDGKAYNYKNVRRWTLPAKLKLAGQASSCVLDCHRIIVPVHLSVHWTCAVIDLEHEKLAFYDSMGVSHPPRFPELDFNAACVKALFIATACAD